LNLLEAFRMIDWASRLYCAGSSECFGNTDGVAASETMPFHPRSPYAVGKASAYWLVNNYREAYGLFACTGILFNHESPLRPNRYVTQKIIQAVHRISKGSGETLNLGRLDVERDWGWAPEYVEAMWLMLQQPSPEDFVIATGETNTLEAFVALAFSSAGLDWRKYVHQDPALFRPTDLLVSRADPSKAHRILSWRATKSMAGVIASMLSSASESERPGA